MKKANILSICMIALISIIGFSCEKNSEEKNFIEVEYRIEFMDQYFNTVTYLDESGNQVVIDDPTKFASGSKKIGVSSKPFNAQLDVQANNSTFSTKHYTLGIFINGELKAFKQIRVNAFDITNASVEYTVQ